MLRLSIDEKLSRLTLANQLKAFSELPYHYALSTTLNGQQVIDTHLSDPNSVVNEAGIEYNGTFAASGIIFKQQFIEDGNGLSETISLTNPHNYPVQVGQVHFGFSADLQDKSSWRLRAIPFLVQLDGIVHDYSVTQLIAGETKNSFYRDASREEPDRIEDGLRSEAWAWGDVNNGIVIIKYNNEAIEYSVARVGEVAGQSILHFGGVGLSMYSEPLGTRHLQPGETFTFGTTTYMPYEGSIQTAYGIYRTFIEQRGHTFPKDYNPPVNWNVLYDIGWHHSDSEKLKQNYHKEALLLEAQKAKDCSCELLYLDPGWEIAEGHTLWDESRLGTVSELVQTLKTDYGLNLGYRTILRSYRKHWDEAYSVQHSYGLMKPETMEPVWGYHFWEPCLCSPEFFAEKLRRILAISKQGIRFMMFDEMDWRGPCYDPNHGHAVPSTALDHIEAVYRLAAEVRRQCPDLLTEVHDAVWPWSNSLYAPTYFRQGAEGIGAYDENWGFEYMWNCIEDLQTGKALALYYYNLGSSIPLYLHITMAADNDACVFFWWTASTVRHMGIGGKFSHPSVEFAGALAAYDRETRFQSYSDHMKLYQLIKPYMVRGIFHGIAEHIHLHTLEEHQGGVINIFNLTEEDQELVFTVPLELLNSGDAVLEVVGAEAVWNAKEVEFRIQLGAMSPGVIRIGDSACL
ncbi:hypothetical protein EHS13_25690 [Paenibacillus psychroresistens]|uniref:Alpha-galactosidase n=1 Tax=Paenibacillus psychroresistens TaxID=1778678 RepID=A0A6B8RQG7_9BACL|nr:hypothetical protein [Paenibacillus psychroresistens]QGQ98044.1 hypothetical protein EHS13_25690 [Paenibacillus psychroresistens]